MLTLKLSFAIGRQHKLGTWMKCYGYQIGVPGINGGSVTEEDLRRGDLFVLPWVNEAVMMHEASRMENERRGAGAPIKP